VIGVLAKPALYPTVREFFELFKTPWEFYQPGQSYDVLLCRGDQTSDRITARLTLIYSSRRAPHDDAAGLETTKLTHGQLEVQYNGSRIPIYGELLTFRRRAEAIHLEPAEPAIYIGGPQSGDVVRIGYDLFDEVYHLLTAGQPAGNAAFPALDLHIALLRNLIIASGETLVEIPPVPHGYKFTASLTHDVDHPSIRRHKFDATMLGFLYRATCGTWAKAARGRASWRNAWHNLTAVFKLPFVYLGFAEDFWSRLDRYVGIDGENRSTYFVIPFQGRAGHTRQGIAPKIRAARYGASDIGGQIRGLTAAGCEIGLHGIDAWLDSESAKIELAEVRRVAGAKKLGVRMHWLYFDNNSPVALEEAGASYDSTVGYNETIGYRAGTTQVYGFPGTSRLMELPLHIMDTALFYPRHLALGEDEAHTRVEQVIVNALQYGGCITVNWHDRSIAPERLWGDFYIHLVAELKARGAWLTSAGSTVAWFRKRRSAVLEEERTEQGEVKVRIATEANDNLPGLQIRIHRALGEHKDIALDSPSDVTGNQRRAFEICVEHGKAATFAETNLP